VGATGAVSMVRRGAHKLLLLGTAALAGCALPRNDAPQAMNAAVQALVQPLVAAQRFSGAVVLMRDGQLLHASGHGLADPERGLRFTPDTPSDGGSLAKNFTAAGLWALMHEGRLQPSHPVQAMVPEYPHAAVTVAQLLDHSNGLAPSYESFDRHFQPGLVRTTSALLALAGAGALCRLAGPPHPRRALRARPLAAARRIRRRGLPGGLEPHLQRA
jgi:CubicO group peptidase (beta-lactamase class C family)